MKVTAKQAAAIAKRIADMAAAITAALPSGGDRWIEAAKWLQRIAAAPAGATLADGTPMAEEQDLLALIAACAAHDDMHPSDWIRMQEVDRSVTVQDRTCKLIGQLMTAGAVQVVIQREGHSLRVAAPTARGLIEVRGDTATEALRRAYDLVDTSR